MADVFWLLAEVENSLEFFIIGELRKPSCSCAITLNTNKGEPMCEQEITVEMLEKLTTRELVGRFALTYREVEVLRERFSVSDRSKDDYSSSIPQNGGDDNGSGGVPAPAKPLH